MFDISKVVHFQPHIAGTFWPQIDNRIRFHRELGRGGYQNNALNPIHSVHEDLSAALDYDPEFGYDPYDDDDIVTIGLTLFDVQEFYRAVEATEPSPFAGAADGLLNDTERNYLRNR